MKSRRTTSKLPYTIHQQLNMYAIAAGAAGVGVLAFAQPVEAKIVYTPTHVVIGYGGLTNYNLDLNHDRITDFTISFLRHIRYGCRDHEFGAIFSLVDSARTSNSIATKNSLVAALHAGERIGSKKHFSGGQKLIERGRVCPHFYSAATGYWKNVEDRYLGLSFQIKGKVHYGWARMTVEFPSFPAMTATLTGYAYETIPAKSIIAGKTKGPADESVEEDFGPGASVTSPIPDKPQPASLGMLALGAQAVPLWRRKEAVGAASENN